MKKNILCSTLGKFKTTHAAKKYFGQNSEMQNCQDQTDPTVQTSLYNNGSFVASEDTLKTTVESPFSKL